jgi:hypothetical protein
MVDDSIITFKPTVSPSVVGTTPTVGAAYDFDPLKPIKAVWMSIPRQTPALLWEPAGGAQKTIEFPLFPFPRPDNIGANAWLGWQSRAAFAYAPVVISGTDASISVRARGSRLGIVSLLGAPRQDRCVTTAPIPNDKAGLNVTYYVPLTADELEHPGVRFIWLRAQDSAGNWGSAMLYPVPNFEEIPAKAVDYSDQTDFKGPDNAVFADALASPKNWKSLSGAKGGAEVMAQEVVRKLPYFSMGNGCFADLEKPVDGSFTAQMKMLPTDWRQGGVVLLTDETGTKGYGLRWDSSNPDQNNGTGHIAIWKLDPGKPITRYTFGSRIGSEGSSGHVIGQQPFADVMLVRDGARGRILLSVDGRVVTTATDATYSHFSRIYLLGNGVQIKELAVLPTGPATP